MTVHDIAKTERTEMYLKAVYSVSQSAPPVTISKVAEYMGVSAPSSYEMLKRLEAQGLLQSRSDEGYRLTPQGMQTATRVVRRLRLAERLLTDILRLPLPRVYAEACKMEHIISPEVEARLEEVLGHPTTCPHGLPIPDKTPEMPEHLRRLDQLRVWDRAAVASIPEEDEEVVAHLVEVGLLPGVQVLVREVAPFDGPITVQVAQQIRAIGRDVARRVRVRTVEPSPSRA
ncbi:MAG: metal-dependent transcriptional regulator [Armatimonadota bacterium]|nr:metal-dependent transcriptional regulator [Armatimonadota bacterium]MDR7518416.1 metal-dependent transcriptional regulator [Armatimonadota bacterium]MDR7549324.1 metal-dependent transcriptional regulator [Armatimonadota bacterium]